MKMNVKSDDVFGYRDSCVAERRAACSWNFNSWSADGQSVDTSKGGGALINKEMDRRVSDRHVLF